MTAEEWIKQFEAKPSTKYTDRYDVNGNVRLSYRGLTAIPISFGVVFELFYCAENNLTSLYNAPIEVGEHFICAYNQLTSLYNAPIKVGQDFACHKNNLTTLDHLPKYIGRDLFCYDNPFQNLNGLKDVEIGGTIFFSHKTEEQLDYWIKALFNTDLDALEYHYDNHKYRVSDSKLENYVMNELEEIIKLKRLKRDLKIS